MHAAALNPPFPKIIFRCGGKKCPSVEHLRNACCVILDTSSWPSLWTFLLLKPFLLRSHRFFSPGKLAFPTFIFSSSLGPLLPPLSTLTRPLLAVPLPFDILLGSKLCRFDGLSSSPFPVTILRFLFSPARKPASLLGAIRSLTILLLFCLITGLATDAGLVAAGRDGAGAALGRGEGAALGRGDGAALEGLDGTVEPEAVLVLILSLGAGRGTGDAIAGGVAIAFGTLMTAGVGFAWAGAGAGVGTLGGGTGVLVTGAGAAVGA